MRKIYFVRKKISDWYEEAEKEVERDLSLDISQLEKKKIYKERAQLILITTDLSLFPPMRG